jgi:hypothetical protein
VVRGGAYQENHRKELITQIALIDIGFICNFSEVANGEKIQTKKSVKSVKSVVFFPHCRNSTSDFGLMLTEK